MINIEIFNISQISTQFGVQSIHFEHQYSIWNTLNHILAYFKPHLGNTLIFDDLLFVEKLEKLFPKYLNIVLFYHKLKVIIYSEKLHLDSVRLLRI